MTIALSALMSGFGNFIEDIPLECTADTGSDATMIVDAALGIYSDGWFNDWYAYITSGNAKGNVRQIDSFTKSTTILDPYVDFSAAIANGNTYQLHKKNPDSIKRAINDAIVSLYSSPPRAKLYRKIVFESLGYDTLIANVAIGATSVVLTNDASRFYAGQVCTIGDTAGSETITLLTVTPSSNTVTFAAIKGAYTTAKSAYLMAQSGKYFNLGATIGYGRVTGVFLKSDEYSTRKRFTAWEIITSATGDRQIYFPKHSCSVDDQTILIEAMDKLETLTDPTNTVTLDDKRVNLLYSEAAYHLYERQSNEVSSGDWERLKALAVAYRRKVYEDYKNLWMPMIQEFGDISTDGD